MTPPSLRGQERPGMCSGKCSTTASLPWLPVGVCSMMPFWRWRYLVAAAVLVVLAATAVSPTNGRDQTNAPMIQQLERSLLSSFGLKKRPRVNKDVQVPPYMLELFRKHQAKLNGPLAATSINTTTIDTDPEPEQHSNDQDDYNTARAFTHEESAQDAQYPGHKMRLRFTVLSLPVEEVVQSAELRFTHARHPQAPDHGPEDHHAAQNLQGRRKRRWAPDEASFLQTVTVHDVLRPATKTSAPLLRLLDTSTVDARRSGVRSLDVTEAVRRWKARPHSNHGLLVTVRNVTKTATGMDASHVRLRRPATEADKWAEQQPLLVVYAKDKSEQARIKRAAPVNKHRKVRETCRRHRLHVDFRQVGWGDWIVAPTNYNAYFCKGECHFPLHDNLNTTNHAVVQTIINSRYPDRVPRACCVPTELSPISMLYIDDNQKFVLKNHQDMVVEGCGCR